MLALTTLGWAKSEKERMMRRMRARALACLSVLALVAGTAQAAPLKLGKSG